MPPSQRPSNRTSGRGIRTSPSRVVRVSPRQSLHHFLRAQADFDGGLVRIDSFQLKSSRLSAAGSVYTTELAVPAAT